jgi:cation/acetate symporter
MVRNETWLRGIFHVHGSIDLWWGIQPISAAVFGVPLGLATMFVVSLLTPAPSEQERAFVRNLRIPRST